jgi:hypothetical protein
MRTQLPILLRFQACALCTVASVLLLSAGCGPPRATIAGAVTIRGKQPNVQGLAIHFLGSDGIPVATLAEADGRYLAENVALGEVRVAVTVTDPEGDKAWEARGETAKGGAPPPRAQAAEETGAARRSRPVIAEKYRDPFKSGLKTTTRPGANTYDIDLQ